MNKERDLLPWILGGLSAAVIAAAFAAVSTHRTAPALQPLDATQPPAAATALRARAAAPVAPQMGPDSAAAAGPAQAPAPSSASMPDSTAPSAPPLLQAAALSETQGGQIWECTTKGVKTFSNNPCGDKSTQLDVGPINTMSAVPALHYVHAYGPEPRYAAGYADQSTPADGDEYPDENTAETGGNSYTIVQGVRFVQHRRPEHYNRAPPTHHNPAPVRRY